MKSIPFQLLQDYISFGGYMCHLRISRNSLVHSRPPLFLWNLNYDLFQNGVMPTQFSHFYSDPSPYKHLYADLLGLLGIVLSFSQVNLILVITPNLVHVVRRIVIGVLCLICENIDQTELGKIIV